MGLDNGPTQSDVPAWYSRLGPNADPSLYKDLAVSIRPDALRDWFFKSNNALGDKSPAELVQEGNLAPLRTAATGFAGDITF